MSDDFALEASSRIISLQNVMPHVMEQILNTISISGDYMKVYFDGSSCGAARYKYW